MSLAIERSSILEAAGDRKAGEEDLQVCFFISLTGEGSKLRRRDVLARALPGLLKV